MPRSVTDAPLTTRAARERLAVRHQPYWRGIDAGAAIGYRKGKSAAAWLVRAADATAGGGYRQEVIGRADDTLRADGAAVLDWRQAEAKAREWITRHHRVVAGLEPDLETPNAPYTVAQAMADYLADYAARGGKAAAQLRRTIDLHINPTLGKVIVGSLTRDRLRTWHRELATAPARLRSKAGAAIRTREPASNAEAQRQRRSTANRILTNIKAALNHARSEGRVSCPPRRLGAGKAVP